MTKYGMIVVVVTAALCASATRAQANAPVLSDLPASQIHGTAVATAMRSKVACRLPDKWQLNNAMLPKTGS